MKSELPIADERAERCETCRWWKPDNPKRSKDGHLINGFGQCHRYPPSESVFDAVKMAINARDAFLKIDDRKFDYQTDTPYTDSLKEASKKDDIVAIPKSDSLYWPPTAQDDFCGEWAAKAVKG